MYMNEQLIRSSRTTGKNNRRDVKTMNRMKLARIGALLTAGLLILILSLCISLFGGDQDAFAAPNGSQVKQTVDVDRGDTLWGIANQHVKKGQSVREYMYELKRVNQLTSNMLFEGQVLILP